MISAIVGTILSGARSYLEHKQRVVEEERKAEIKLVQQKAELEILAQKQSIELAGADAASERAKKHSYLDEILIFGPILLVIYTVIDPETAMEVIQALSAYPVWVQLIIVGVYISVFGLRSIFSGLTRFLKK